MRSLTVALAAAAFLASSPARAATPSVELHIGVDHHALPEDNLNVAHAALSLRFDVAEDLGVYGWLGYGHTVLGDPAGERRPDGSSVDAGGGLDWHPRGSRLGARVGLGLHSLEFDPDRDVSTSALIVAGSLVPYLRLGPVELGLELRPGVLVEYAYDEDSRDSPPAPSGSERLQLGVGGFVAVRF